MEDRVIEVMPEALANKIAAGEVVQRPASAIKELMENALDAGADQITVLIKKAGAELMQVIDNGCGMGAEDAGSCFLRHATSKIREVEDLERIRTLGFRGEALASIAAVAQVELRTKRMQDETGFCVRVEGAHLKESFPIATPNGSSFAVRNLFYNVPARRNFLKSPATEFKRIVEVFQFLALSNPDVGFHLVHDDREIYRFPAHDDPETSLQQRIADLFEVAPSVLVPVQDEAGYLRVSGFVSKPTFTRKTKSEQYFFVNKRFIKSNKLETAVSLGYGEMLPKGAYPFFALFLSLDPIHVDVNVHPTKTEVQFDDESGLFGFIRGAVKRALGQLDISPFVGYDATGKLTEQVNPSESTAAKPLRNHTSTGQTLAASWQSNANPSNRWSAPRATPHYQAPQKPIDLFKGDHRRISDALYGESLPDLPPNLDHLEPSVPEPERSAETALQVHDKYLLAQTETGFMIVDQHAAHERILYERFLKAMEAGQGASQQLLFPHTHSFEHGDFALLEELLPDLKALGFGLELLSGRSVLITGVPADVPTGREEVMLEEVLDQYKNYKDGLNLKGRDNLAKSLSCRAAIKTGKKLNQTEIRALLAQLMGCEMPYACPHGRPTIIKMSVDELDKRFGRIGHLETQGTIKRG